MKIIFRFTWSQLKSCCPFYSKFSRQKPCSTHLPHWFSQWCSGRQIPTRELENDPLRSLYRFGAFNWIRRRQPQPAKWSRISCVIQRWTRRQSLADSGCSLRRRYWLSRKKTSVKNLYTLCSAKITSSWLNLHVNGAFIKTQKWGSAHSNWRLKYAGWIVLTREVRPLKRGLSIIFSDSDLPLETP